MPSESVFPDVSLSVVIPAYNEEGNVETVIPRVVEALRRMVGRFELILVDDASTDRTPELFAAMAGRYPEIRVVRNEKNLRQGGSLARGYALAKLDYVMHEAMDYPFDLEELRLLLPHFPDADIVVASRPIHGARTYADAAGKRFVASWGNRALMKLVFGVPVRDFTFIQIYKRAALERLRTKSTSPSMINAEKVIRAHKGGMRVVDVDVAYLPREVGQSSSVTAKNVRHALRDIARLRLDLWLGR
jgi:glycosyltransferase involved in cell wall biosynthesis